jgi:Bacterial Ig-like domain (group 3)
MSEFDNDLERELRAAAPQARPLFVDEVARRLHAQRPGLRPSRFRLSLALAFSVLTAVALGMLGAPAYVAHAANALLQTASFGDGNSARDGATSGSSQYEASVPLCHRTNTDPLSPTWTLIVDKPSNHDGHADIIPAPPWGCPGNERPHRPGDPSATTTSVKASVEGPGNTKNPKTFVVTVGAADSSRPSGTVLCFDNLVQFGSAPLVDGRATCSLAPRPAGTHSVTAMFRTGDYKKWASSAGNVLTFTVGKGP